MKIVSVIQGTTYASGVSTSVFSEHIKMDYASDSNIITLALNAAVQYLEGILWMNFVNKSVIMIDSTWSEGEWEIPIHGTLGTTTVQYYNSSNVLTTLTVGAGELWLEQIDEHNSVLHLTTASLPSLYDRKDAVKITMALAATDASIPSQVVELIYQLGAYFYDCRANKEEPNMTVVEKLASGMRLKVF